MGFAQSFAISVRIVGEVIGVKNFGGLYRHSMSHEEKGYANAVSTSQPIFRKSDSSDLRFLGE